MIGVGIGGWTYAPWRGTFYPPGLPQARELSHAASRLSAIEINATFHRLQKPESFRKWAESVPGGFVFAVKASRYATNRKLLAEAGPSVDKFLAQGLDALGERLGPILWQLPSGKRFDADDVARFLDLLPQTLGSRALRHAVEARGPGFDDPAFRTLAQERGIAVVHVEDAAGTAEGAAGAGFFYARFKRASETEAAGYPPAELDRIAAFVRNRAGKGDMFAFFIGADKVCNPAAAEALIQRLG